MSFLSFLHDDSADWFRLFVLLACFACTGGLLWRYTHPPNNDWNPKTKDYWFSLVMWSLAGSAATFESLLSNDEYTMRSAFILAAALTCLNGLRAKGSWGVRVKDKVVR